MPNPNTKISRTLYTVLVEWNLGIRTIQELLKHKQYKVNGHELEVVVMTARVDNPGSWKAGANGGMEVYDIDTNPKYGPELRYQMRKNIGKKA